MFQLGCFAALHTPLRLGLLDVPHQRSLFCRETVDGVGRSGLLFGETVDLVGQRHLFFFQACHLVVGHHPGWWCSGLFCLCLLCLLQLLFQCIVFCPHVPHKLFGSFAHVCNFFVAFLEKLSDAFKLREWNWFTHTGIGSLRLARHRLRFVVYKFNCTSNYFH